MSTEVRIDQQDGSEEAVIHFVSKCISGYYISICHFPIGCSINQFTTFTIMRNTQDEARGFYQHQVKYLLPCSIFKWEISSMTGNITLYEDFLFTTAGEDAFILNLPDARVESKHGTVQLSWTISQPCITQYQIKLCHEQDDNDDECWEDKFERPTLDQDNNLQVDIDLASLSNFELNYCQGYVVTMSAIVNGRLQESDLVLKFVFIEQIPAPTSLNVVTVTSSSVYLTWQASNCSNSRDVLILVISSDDVTEYHPQSHTGQFNVTNLRSCSNYTIKILTVEAGETSEHYLSTMITTHGDEDDTKILLDVEEINETSFRYDDP